MNQISEEKEVYMRFSRRLSRLLVEDTDEMTLRKLPSAIRQDQCFRVPSLSSFEYLAYFLFLIYRYPEADYQISIYLNQVLQEARRNHYEGKWKIWKCASIYFNLEREGRGTEREMVPQLNLSPNFQEVEGTIFSPYYFIEFLMSYFSEDDLFGNLCPLASQLGTRCTRVETLGQRARRLRRQRVRKAQRHRGHTDKGSPRHVRSAREPRAINLGEEEFKYDSLVHTRTWGIEDTPDPIEPEEEPPKQKSEGQKWAEKRYKELYGDGG